MTERLDRYRPELLAASLCGGLAFANAIRVAVSVAILGVLAIVVAAAVRSAPRVLLVAGALALAGWGWGSARLDVLDRSALTAEIGQMGRTVAVVTGPARRSSYEVRVPATVVAFGRRRVREPVLLELPLGRAPPQGAYLDLVGRVLEPRPAEDGFDERTWLRRRGVHVIVRGESFRVVGRRGGLTGLADGIRARLERTIAPGLEGERRAVVAGIVLGADDGLSEELRDAFRASGMYHLLAVSGQNVALVALGVVALAWVAGIGRIGAQVGVLAAIAAYVLAVGWQPSVVRAGVAGALASLAWLTARQRSRWHFLLLGAVVLLAWNPYSLLEPGFQLSFCAVAAIFIGVRPLRRVLDGYPIPRALADVIAVAVACAVATAPIVWAHFGAVAIYSVASNALAAPAVPPLLGLAFAAALVAPVSPSAAEAIAVVEGWLASYLASCARAVAALPHAQVTSGVLLLALAAVAVLAAAALRLRAPRGPRALVLAAMAAVLVGGWVTRPARPPPGPPDGLRLTFLDVGQGDGILAQAPGAAVLVDQGPPEADVAQQLVGLGIKKLTAVVLTHPQRDHVGGAADVLARLRVGLVLDPGLRSDSPEERAALAVARRRRVRVVVTRSGDSYAIGRLRLRVLWPDSPGPPGDDPNRHAIVILLSYGRVDALLTADAESEVTLPLRPPRVEILKVAHHGSADPGLPELLRQTDPDVAVISVGERNDYGHPAPSTLAALAWAPGLSVFRTDRDGRVVLESDGERVWIQRGG